MMGDDTVKVLFLTGWDRSGSTVLALLLSAVDGFFSVGELQHLWKRGLIERRLCGCGFPLVECEVWAPILTSVYGRMPTTAEAQAMVTLRSQQLRVRHTWRILKDRGRGLGGYVSFLRQLYQHIARRTQARVIVDSSKDPSDAAALTLLPGVRTYFVHLVRDPRAVAYSMSRRPKPQPDTREPSRMARQSPAKSTLNWLTWNLGAERVRREVPPASWIFLRYEDMADRPRRSLQRIIELVGEESINAPFLDDRTAALGLNHTISGNPVRLGSGTITIQKDDEWVREQPASDRLISTILALPLMIRYGYRPLVAREEPQLSQS